MKEPPRFWFVNAYEDGKWTPYAVAASTARSARAQVHLFCGCCQYVATGMGEARAGATKKLGSPAGRLCDADRRADDVWTDQNHKS